MVAVSQPRGGGASVLDRWLVVVLTALVATAGIQWLDITSAGMLSLKWFHLVAAALLLATAFSVDLGGRLLRVVSLWGTFWAAWAAYLAAVLVAQIVHADPYFPLPHVPKQVLYSGIGLAAAVAVSALEQPRARRALGFAALATAATGLAALCRPLLAAGVNPASVTWTAIRTGQPDLIIFGVFQRAFVATEGALSDSAQANLRHGLASALALSLFLTALVRPTLTARSRRVATASIVLAATLLVLTLSRSAILAVLIWLALMALTPVVRGRGPARQWMLPVALAVAGLLVLVAPVGQVLEQRFVGEQGSAAVRGANSTEVIEAVDRYPLGADGLTIESSPHNIALDGLLAGGFPAAVAGLVILGTYLVVLGRLVGSHLRDGPWALPLSRAATIGVGVVPLVRLVSAGGGLLNLAEWVGAGAFMGLVALERRRAEGLPRATTAPPGTATPAGASR